MLWPSTWYETGCKTPRVEQNHKGSHRVSTGLLWEGERGDKRKHRWSSTESIVKKQWSSVDCWLYKSWTLCCFFRTSSKHSKLSTGSSLKLFQVQSFCDLMVSRSAWRLEIISNNLSIRREFYQFLYKLMITNTASNQRSCSGMRWPNMTGSGFHLQIKVQVPLWDLTHFLHSPQTCPISLMAPISEPR